MSHKKINFARGLVESRFSNLGKLQEGEFARRLDVFLLLYLFFDGRLDGGRLEGVAVVGGQRLLVRRAVVVM